MTQLYPVAANADAAVQAPLGHAVREREARTVAGDQKVEFVTDWAGPSWPTKDEALAAFSGKLSGAEDGWWSILPVIVPPAGAKGRSARPVPLKPAFKDGRRWPKPDETHRFSTAWRLSIRYWRAGETVVAAPSKPARKLRRDPDAGELEAGLVKSLADQPLRPHSPQRALDIGLFEFRPPEAPHILMPDE
jgi:hypothetical protein